MARTIFVQSSKLNNVRGRISYISSPARQENLYAVYETTERNFWTRLARENERSFKLSGTEGKCIEARELIIALPKELREYDPNELLRDYTETFKKEYGVECVSALHHNKTRTNYHIHLIFSERKELEEPVRKIAPRNFFYDETGKKVRTKKEILDEHGEVRKGCKIIKKGEVYEEHYFDKKNPKFKQKKFLEEVKQLYVEKINEKSETIGYKMKVFEKETPYLPMKKIGKNNPKAKYIRQNNKKRLKWNMHVSKAIDRGIPVPLLIAVKVSEVTKPVQEAMLRGNEPMDIFMRIVDRAITTLDRFVSDLLQYKLTDEIKPYSERFYKGMDACRPHLKKSINKEWER